jgi:hypothetical protein
VDLEPPECAETLNPLREIPSDETRHWWKRPGIREAIPETPAEALIKYNALSWQIDFAEKSVVNHLKILSGRTLLDAAPMFSTKKAWTAWLRENVKTCEMTTHHANANLQWAEHGARWNAEKAHLIPETRFRELLQQALAEQPTTPEPVEAEIVV